MKKKEVLFVLNEAGAASFVEPLLAQDSVPWNWRLCLGPGAESYLKKGPLASLLPQKIKKDEENFDFDVLISSASPSPMECSALSRAKDLGARSAVIMDTWYNYKRRWQGLDPKPDSVFVIDTTARTEAEAEGLPSESLKIMGHPHFEEIPLLSPQPKTSILFVDQPILKNYGMSLGYNETTAWQVLLQAREKRPALFLELFYSVHPESPLPDSKYLKNVECLNVREKALEKSGTVIGMFSNVLLDAWYSGRHVISLQPGLVKEDFCILSRRGEIPRVETSEELIQVLEALPSFSRRVSSPFSGSKKNLEEWIG